MQNNKVVKMSIIGIIASQRQTNQIKKEIEKQNIKVEIVCINSRSIENVKNIKFEILIIQDSLEKLKEKQEHIRKMLIEAKYVLLNTDQSIKEEIFKDIDIKILTYGLKRKATITLSSIEESQVIISIQRAFKNLEGKIIEQQEIPIEVIKKSTKNLYNCLIKIAIIKFFNVKNR